MARICMLAFTHYSTDSRVRREAEALTARGDEVDFVCLKEAGKEHIRDYHGVHLYPIGVGRYRGQSTLLYLARYCAVVRKRRGGGVHHHEPVFFRDRERLREDAEFRSFHEGRTARLPAFYRGL